MQTHFIRMLTSRAAIPHAKNVITKTRSFKKLSNKKVTKWELTGIPSLLLHTDRENQMKREKTGRIVTLK